MRKNLSSGVIGLIGILILGINFIFEGVLPGLLSIVGIIFVIVSIIGMVMKKKEPRQN